VKNHYIFLNFKKKDKCLRNDKCKLMVI